MIAKRIRRKKQTSSFARLGKYVVDARGGIDPASWTRTADYILDTRQHGAKVGGVRVTNCATEDAAAATLEILAVQARNTRSKSEKSYHMVISFPEGERPTPEQLRYIEDSCCAAIGLADHQRISAIHIDTDHLHIHVAINKVHPVSFRNVEPYYDHQRLMETCEKLEIELGLTRTNHGIGKGLDVDDEAEDRFLQWVKTNACQTLTAAAATLKSWDEFHAILAKFDLQVRKHGAGLVIGTSDGQLTVKASSVARELSFKALTDRFGEFTPSGLSMTETEPVKRYVPKSRESADTDLYRQYLEERERLAVARQARQAELQSARTAYVARLNEWYDEKYRIIKASNLPAVEKLVAYKELRNERLSERLSRRATDAEQREKLAKDLPYLTWESFLMREAESGNAIALKALRSRQRRQAQMASDILTAESMVDARDIVFEKLKPHARRNGDMLYTAPDGGSVLDTKTGIRVRELTPGAAVIALTLATERFGESALVIQGSEEFKSAMSRFAILQDMEINFGNEGLEPKSDRGRNSPCPAVQARRD
jgi:hypothetical protein